MKREKPKDRNDFQTTIRMPSSMWEEIVSITEPRGMTVMEWIRRAIRDALDRENGTAPDAQVSRAEFDELKRRFAELEEDADAMKKFLEATKKESRPEEA